jgi:uncharacterized small protein (DUF1192 family)
VEDFKLFLLEFYLFISSWKHVVPLADGRPPVRDARRQHIKVVSLDWLEDSLLSSSRRPKPEKEYEVGNEQLGLRSVTELHQWDIISKKEREKKQAIEASNDNAIKEARVLHSPWGARHFLS